MIPLLLILLSLASVGWAGEPEWYLLAEGGYYDSGKALIESHCFVVYRYKKEPLICSRDNPPAQSDIGEAIVTLSRGGGFPYDRPCLDQMAQAMREGEPYIFGGKTFSYPMVGSLPPRSGQEGLGEQIVEDTLKWQMYEQLDRITQLWTEAKQCWRKP